MGTFGSRDVIQYSETIELSKKHAELMSNYCFYKCCFNDIYPEGSSRDIHSHMSKLKGVMHFNLQTWQGHQLSISSRSLLFWGVFLLDFVVDFCSVLLEMLNSPSYCTAWPLTLRYSSQDCKRASVNAQAFNLVVCHSFAQANTIIIVWSTRSHPSAMMKIVS